MRRSIDLLLRTPAWAYLVLASLGLMLVGGAIGHAISPPSADGEQVLAPLVAVGEQKTTEPERMPDIRGLNEDSASRVLADEGISANVRTSTAPYAGPPGLVVTQEPAPGQEVPGEVVLALSIPATMPALVREALDEAVAQLESLGSVARVAYEIRPEIPPGTVLSTEPPVGETLGLVSTVTVASEGDGLSLADLNMAGSSSCSRDDDRTTVAGREVLRAVYCSPGDPDRPSYVSYTIRRKVTFLRATLGIDDDDDPGSATVRAVADGVEIGRWDIGTDDNETIQVNLRKAIRLRIEVIKTQADNDSTVVLGDAIFVGRPDDLSVLADLG